MSYIPGMVCHRPSPIFLIGFLCFVLTFGEEGDNGEANQTEYFKFCLLYVCSTTQWKKRSWERDKMTERSRGTDTRIVACEQSIFIGVFGASVSSSARNYVALSSASRLEVWGLAVNFIRLVSNLHAGRETHVLQSWQWGPGRRLLVLLVGYSAALTKQRDSLQVNLTSFFVLNTFMICYYYSTGCFEALGIQSGEFDDGEIAASSMLKNFSSTDAWCPPKVDENQYLQVDLSRKTEITKLATQGEIGSKDRHVKTYALLYSDDGKKWKQYESHGKEKVKLLHILILFILSIS